MLTRREFLRNVCAIGGALAGASLLAACGQQAPAPAPTAPLAQPTGAPAAQPTAAAAPTAAPAQAAPAAAKPGGTLTVAITEDPVTLDPPGPGNPQNRMIRGAIHEALIDIDEQGKPIPWLAEAWEQTDPTTYVFHLRKGIKFHDGTEFNADVVKFNLERMMNPDVKNLWRSEIAALDKVEVVDASTVRVKAKGPFAGFIIPFYDMNGMQASPTAVQKWGDEYGFHPVGTGPFKFVEYTKDNRTVIEKNPDYWDKGKPQLDQVIFRPIPDNSTRLTELRSGGAQIIEYLPFQDVERLKGGSDVVVSEKTGFRVDWLTLNVEKEPATSKEFRQAWTYLIDRDAIQAAVYRNTGSPAWDLQLPGSRYFDPNYKPATRDVAKAKQLLDASGVKLPFEFTIYTDQDPVRKQEVQVLQANAAEVGINIQTEALDRAAWLARHQSGDFLAVLSWWGYRPDPDQYLSVLLSTKGSWNWSRYSSPRMDALLEAERVELDDAKRTKIFRDIADLTTDDMPVVPYHYGSNIKGLSPKVQGFVHRVDGLIRFTDIRLG